MSTEIKHNILYMGHVIDLSNIDKYSGVSVAGAQFEWNMVDALNNITPNRFCSISIPPIASWPRDEKKIIKTVESRIAQKVFNISCGFLNIPLIKQLTQIINCYRAGKHLVEVKKIDVLISFNAFPQIGIPSFLLKRKYNLNHICILADLPIDDSPKKNKLFRRIIWSLYGGLSRYLIKKCKKFILVNQFAEKYIPEKSIYEIIEGGIIPCNYSYHKSAITDDVGRKIIIYSGALTNYSGVMELIKAMDFLKDLNVVLRIYGSGYLEQDIKNISREKTNIEFKGFVDIRQMRKIQTNSWLLVNPRPVDDEISKVTFPSKILEYMASGTPVLSTKLTGITNEYYNYLYFSDGDSSQCFASSIRDLYYLKSIEYKGIKAKEFVCATKSWDEQVCKIFDLMSRN